jgi:hypothetical protein
MLIIRYRTCNTLTLFGLSKGATYMYDGMHVQRKRRERKACTTLLGLTHTRFLRSTPSIMYEQLFGLLLASISVRHAEHIDYDKSTI